MKNNNNNNKKNFSTTHTKKKTQSSVIVNGKTLEEAKKNPTIKLCRTKNEKEEEKKQ